MPLFMDYHKLENITMDLVKTAHTADLAIQDQYGVKYHQYWVNEEEGSVFCLVEGPDKETCEKVHQLAHGNIACALTEVESGLYEKLMGKEHRLDEGLVSHPDGSRDTGYRTIMVISALALNAGHLRNESSRAIFPAHATKQCQTTIAEFGGREVLWSHDGNIIAIFNDADQAVKCALALRLKWLEPTENGSRLLFRIGISAAQPVTKEGDFFSEAIRLAHLLNITAVDTTVLISSLAQRICKQDPTTHDGLRCFSSAEEEFLKKFWGVTEARLSDLDFHLNELSQEIGVSRPQLYRKITSITGRPPNDFLRDIRMNKALQLLNERKLNISEIAFETGFNSPSYFTKCFTEKFGFTPSAMAKKG